VDFYCLNSSVSVCVVCHFD